MADMQRRRGVPGEQAVPRHDRLLRSGRPAGQSQSGGDFSLMGLSADGESRILGVLGNHPAEPSDVLQGPAHQQ